MRGFIMNNEIENLVDTYESGQMTRRQLVAKLGMMMGFVSGVGQLWASESDKAEQENIGSQRSLLNHFQGVSMPEF